MDEQILHKPGKCAYCGDAPVNHTLFYLGGLASMLFDATFGLLVKYTPRFAVRAVEALLKGILRLMVALRIVTLSNNPEKATTLRSRVIWDEAIRRGIKMEQLVIFGRYTDNYRAKVNGKYIFFDSLPLPDEAEDLRENWDDKFFMKEKFARAGIPAPRHAVVPLGEKKLRALFDKFSKPLIVKPRLGSRGRHTTTNINTFKEFLRAVKIARQISPKVITEEHLEGYVCRATCVAGKLAGFYRAESAFVVSDGKRTIAELIKDKNAGRHERISEIQISNETKDFIARSGHSLHSIPPSGMKVNLSHRIGRLFGGETEEMLSDLHMSFVPVLERAAAITGLLVLGFDCIIPDPRKPGDSQRWGIIECNTLPFIDLHYFALSGKPQNIAGFIWDFWQK